MLYILLAILAAYRLSRLIAYDDIFKGMRQWVGRKAAGSFSRWRWVADLVHCPHCSGVWFAAFLAVMFLFIYPETGWKVILVWLGIAGGQELLQSVTGER